MQSNSVNHHRPVVSSGQQVLVCQHKTCLKDGAAPVLQTLQSQQTAAIAVVASGCLGNCGNGPTVLVLPEQTLYSRVELPDLPAITSRPGDNAPKTQRQLSAPTPVDPSTSMARSRRVAIVMLGLAILLIVASLGWGVYSLV